jgi:hypothetical protein
MPPSVETDLQSLGRRFNIRSDLPMKRTSAKNQSQRRPVDIAEVSLTRGQVNAVRVQGWHHALTDCTTVCDFPIECAEGVGIRQAEALKAGSGLAACRPRSALHSL